MKTLYILLFSILSFTSYSQLDINFYQGDYYLGGFMHQNDSGGQWIDDIHLYTIEEDLVGVFVSVDEDLYRFMLYVNADGRDWFVETEVFASVMDNSYRIHQIGDVIGYMVHLEDDLFKYVKD